MSNYAYAYMKTSTFENQMPLTKKILIAPFLIFPHRERYEEFLVNFCKLKIYKY